MSKYAIPDPWTSDANPFDFDIEGEGRRRQANAKGLNRVKPNAAQKAATRREITKWREAAKLSREFNKFKKDYSKAQHEIKKFHRTTTQTVSKVQKALQPLQRITKPIQDLVKKAPVIEKGLKASGKLIENLKNGLFKEVMPNKAGQLLTGVVSIGIAGLYAFDVKNREYMQQIDLDNQTLVQSDLQRQMNKIVENTVLLRSLNKRVDANDAAIDVMSGAIGEKTKYIDRMINEFQIKVEGQKTISDKQGDLILNLVKTVFTDVAPTVKQQKVEIKNLQAQVRVLGGGSRQPNQPNNQAQINQLNTKVNNVEKKVEQNDKEIAVLKKAPNLPGNILQKVQDAVSAATSALGKVGKLEKEIPGTITKLVDGKITEVIQASNKALKDELGIEITKKVDKDNLVTEIKQRNGDIIRVLEPAIKETTKQIVDQKVKPLEVVSENVRAAVGNILEMVGGHGKTINEHTKRIDREGIDNDKQAIDIETLKQKNRELDKKIKEQEKVNQEGNKKLDDLLKWTLGISPVLALIPAKTRDLIRPDIPTRPQIGQIVRDNTPQSSCRFSEVPINNAASRVNAHSTALDVAQTAIITNVNNTTNTINSKLGGLIPNGGIAGAITRIFDNKIVDRAIAYITMVTSMHNALMLSNNLAQTLFSAGDTILQALGVKIKDAKGEEIGVGQVIQGMFENTFKTIFGEDNYGGMRKAWLQYSRIYQSASNLLNNVQSMFDTARNIAEMTVMNVGKIGNALKKAGAVYENAYNWMSEKASAATARQQAFERFRQGLETAENITSSIESVASDVVSIQSELQEFNKNKNDFTSAINGEVDKKTEDEQKEKPNLTLTFDGANLNRSDSDE